MKKIGVVLLAILMCLGCFVACSDKSGKKATYTIDYESDVDFENALNAGEDLTGKIVKFKVLEFNPTSSFGYDLYAGEHLNFVSSEHPGIKAGDTVVAKATKIERVLKSWIITYEKLDVIEGNGDSESKKTEASESASTSAATSTKSSSNEKKELEVVESGFYESSRSGNKTYLYAYAKVYNPNEKIMAEFPKLTVTVKNAEGAVLATDYQSNNYVMPNDTIMIVASVGVTDYSTDCKVELNVKSDLVNVTELIKKQNSLTSDFTFVNVSEVPDKYYTKITGEIINNFSTDVDDIQLTLVLRKDGEVVYTDRTYVDDLKVGANTAFEFTKYSKSLPAYDTIELYAQQW